ncbi:hypothetical protein CSB86_5157 [Pseudomonas aeruginosa]|uniref:hypothetical protein n=1 Tax=Achromobacter ruhlandii TaxID=72557 RepID=UPI000E190A23|nr:hypothetical protein CSB86_5157 [Pseudomonas aeruginosa]
MVQITSDIELSGAGCTTAITPNQLVQSSSENDNGHQVEAIEAAGELSGNAESSSSLTLYRLPA